MVLDAIDTLLRLGYRSPSTSLLPAGLIWPTDMIEPLRLPDSLDPLTETALDAARVVICKGSVGWRRDDFCGLGARFLLSSIVPPLLTVVSLVS